MNDIKINIRNIGIVSASDSLIRLYFPIQTVYYLSLGISFTEIAAALAIFNLTAFLFEYPSGYLADRLGRKWALLLSAILFFCSFLILYNISSTWMLCLANAVMGVAYAMNSGADQALLFDTLKHAGKESEYKENYSRVQYYAALSAALFALASGFLASINFRLPFLAAVIFSIPVIFCATQIKEERALSDSKPPLAFNQMYSIFTHTILKRKDLLWFMLLSSVISSIAWSSQHFIYPQFIYSELNLPLQFLGLVYFLFHIFRALASKLTVPLRVYLKNKVYFAMLAVLTLCYLSIVCSPWFLAVFCLIVIDSNEIVKKILISEDLNDRIESSIRASVLSVEGVVKWGIWSVHCLITGFIIDNFGFLPVCIFQIVLYALLGLFLFLNLEWVNRASK